MSKLADYRKFKGTQQTPTYPTTPKAPSGVVSDAEIPNYGQITPQIVQEKRLESTKNGITLPSGRVAKPLGGFIGPEGESPYKMNLAKTIKDKFDIDVEDDSLAGRLKKSKKEFTMTSEQRKEYGQLLQDYIQSGALEAPVRSGIAKGATFGDMYAGLRENAPAETEKLEQDPRFKIGEIGGTFAKYGAAYSLLGPAIAGPSIPTAGGIGAATGTLAPTAAQSLAYTLGTGAAGAFGTELAKDIAIGGAVGATDALMSGADVKKTIAENIAYDIAFNAILGVGGKTIKLIKDLKNAKNAKVIANVADSLKVTPAEAEKVIDDAVDFYVNKSGVASDQPLEQLLLPSPKGMDDFTKWRKEQFGGAFGKVSDADELALKQLYKEDTGIDIIPRQKETPMTVNVGELSPSQKFKQFKESNVELDAFDTSVKTEIQRIKSQPNVDDVTKAKQVREFSKQMEAERAKLVKEPAVAKSVAEDIGIKPEMIEVEIPKKQAPKPDFNEKTTRPEEDLLKSFNEKVNRDVPKKKKSFGQMVNEVLKKSEDDLRELGRLEKSLTGGKLASAEKSLYKTARLFKGSPDAANELIRTRIAPIIKGIESKNISYEDLGDYALAVHARDVNNAGLNSGFTNQEIDAVIKKFEGNKEIEKARQDLLAVSDDLLNQLRDDGLLSAEQLTALKTKWKNYMPLFRAFDDEKVEFVKGLSESFSNVSAPIKKLKGSERDVIDPIESMIKNIYKVTNATMRNRVGTQLARLAEIDVDGKFIRKLGEKEAVGRKNVVNVTVDGKKVGYEVDPEVYKTFNNLDKETSNLLIDILSKPASVLRAGATLTPEFALRNPLRDIQTAFVVSESGFNPFDFVSGLASYINKDDLYSQWLKEGGGYGSVFSMDRNAHQQVLKDILKTPATDKFVNLVTGKSIIKALRGVSEATEAATKIGEFKKALSKGATPQEAAYRARDLMDFSRAGSSVRPANKIIAFLNANIQGKSKLLRAIKERPAAVGAKMITSMALPSVGVYAWNDRMANEKQKETIDQSPAWLKNTFWLVAIPGTDLVGRIPKPFDMSVLANTTERFLDYVAGQDKEAFDGFIKQTVKDQSIPVMISGIVPLIEVMANYSFFRDSPVIPTREQYLKREDQFDNSTSEIAKLIAGGIRGVAGEETDFGSPRAIDYILKNTTAGLGTTVLDASDYIFKSLGMSDKGEKPDKGITNFPGLKGFLVSETMSYEAVGDVYDTIDKLQREKGSLKQDLQEEYGSRYNDDILKRRFEGQKTLTYLNGIADEMSDISKEIRKITNDKTMSGDKKQTEIKKLTDERNSLAVKAMKRAKEIGK